MPIPLIPPHGGYRSLRSFQVATLVYDATVLFCDKYISKKTELKLTNVAKASLEELLLDYEAFLRQNSHAMWDAESSLAQQCRNAKPNSITELRQLMMQLKTSRTGPTSP